MTRGRLVAPDPTLVEPCARPDCGHPEGDHLLCGCQCWTKGDPCGCPGFALDAPQCPHCRRYFDTVWKFDVHMRFLRYLDPVCRAAEKRRAAEDAERARRRAAKAGA